MATCTTMGHEDEPSTGRAQAGDDERWYDYCAECLRILEDGYPVRRYSTLDGIGNEELQSLANAAECAHDNNMASPICPCPCHHRD